VVSFVATIRVFREFYFILLRKETPIMASSIKPLGDRLLVQRLEAEGTTAGGIVLPDTAKEKPKEGEIIALGSGRVLDNGEKAPFSVSKGDRIIFSSFAGTDVSVNGDEYLIMKEEDILAIVK
tara:strand:- start:431 stop:799 length:369 start_codon:yes stop_codon:yes gene_type:complete